MGTLRDRILLHPGLDYDRRPYGTSPGRDPELLLRGIEPPSPLERAGMDGLSVIELEVFHHEMCAIVEEAREVYSSLSISEAIIGFGKQRGGAPVVEISMAPPAGCSTTSRGRTDRLSRNPGIFGGYAGQPTPRFVIRDTDLPALIERNDARIKLAQHELAREQPLPGTSYIEASSQPTAAFRSGDTFVYSHGGGGGDGDVLEREPAAVVADVRTGILSSQGARDHYQVVFDAYTREVDTAATEQARSEER